MLDPLVGKGSKPWYRLDRLPVYFPIGEPVHLLPSAGQPIQNCFPSPFPSTDSNEKVTGVLSPIHECWYNGTGKQRKINEENQRIRSWKKEQKNVIGCRQQTQRKNAHKSRGWKERNVRENEHHLLFLHSACLPHQFFSLSLPFFSLPFFLPTSHIITNSQSSYFITPLLIIITQLVEL